MYPLTYRLPSVLLLTLDGDLLPCKEYISHGDGVNQSAPYELHVARTIVGHGTLG